VTSTRRAGRARTRPARGPDQRTGEHTDRDIEQDIEQGPPGDPEAVARLVCLRLLERRARSRHELAEALRSRRVPDDAAETVLNRFVEVGLIDDVAFAQSLTGAVQRERGLSRRAVAHKLRQRGVPDEVVDETVADIDPAGERARAEQLVARRRRSLASLPPEVQTRRLVGLLARKGYPSGMAYEVVRAELARDSDEALVSDLMSDVDSDLMSDVDSDLMSDLDSDLDSDPVSAPGLG
jgi:regulatory protein